MPDTLSLRALNRATLARQLLLDRSALAPRDALERIGGLQAQWPKPPYVGLWTRLASFERDQLSEMLRKRQAIRATMMRGTIHVATTKEYLAIRTTLQPALTRGLAAIRDRGKNLDADKVIAAASELFSKPRTFEEVRDALIERFPNVNERAMGYVARMMLPLAMIPTGDSWGFPSIAQFQLVDSWIGKPVPARADVSALLLRYFAAFGPATIQDAQTWTGLQGLKPAVGALGSKLRTFKDDRKRELFDVVDGPLPDEDTIAPIRFLPEFDNILMGYQDRSRVVADEHRKFVSLPGLRVAATVLVDGVVTATWKIERKGKRATIAVQMLSKAPKKVSKEIEAEAERLLAFAEPDAATREVRYLSS